MSITGKGLAEFAESKIGTDYCYGMKGTVLTEEKYNELKKLYPNEVLDSDKDKVGKVCVDCSGLIYWYTKTNYNSSQIYKNSTKKFPISDIKNAPIGAVLYTSGHVAVYDGMSGGIPYCVEAMDSAHGVVKSKVTSSRFDEYILPDYIDYSDHEVSIKDYNEALDRLIVLGVINTADYWQVAVSTMKYVDVVLINAAKKCCKKTSDITVFSEALTKCMNNKIFSDGGYWSKAAKTNKYVNNLIINIANHL